jgi:hypothetical protein
MMSRLRWSAVDIVRRELMPPLAVSSVSEMVTAMRNRVEGILTLGAPVKVLDSIVGFHPVAVARFMRWRTWTNESFKHQNVYPKGFAAVAPA